VSPRDESERRVAEALRARTTGVGWTGPPGLALPPNKRARGPQPVVALLIALLAGGVLGVGLALISILVPGLLPALG